MGLAESIRETYQRAAKEVDKKMKDFWAKHKAKAEKKLQDVASGKISMDDYKRWLSGQVFIGERWKEKLDDITRTYVEADEKAREIINKTDKNVFVRFANAQGRDIKSHIAGYSFDLYDKHTVERLLKEDPKMLPEWKINEPKDYTWNEKRVKNEIMQGIIQGEDIPSIAKRLSSGLATSNHKKMNMFARTAVTGAQNAGRMERLHEAQDMGVVVKKKWLATMDKRTRDVHRDELNGVEVAVDEPFHTSLGDIMFPGDPNADPANTYNCRCTLVYVYDVKASAENLKESSDTSQEELTNPQTRGHVDMTVKENYTKSKWQLIQQDTEMDEETAKDTATAIKLYTTSDKYEAEMVEYQWTGQGSDQVKKYVEDLESYIEQAPKWDAGDLYRGERVKKSEFETWQVGKTLEQDRITSWSSKTEVADKFAKFNVKSNEVSVKYVLDAPSGTPTNGVSIAHLSGKSKEMEVLFGKGEGLTITSIEEVPVTKSKSVFVVHVTEEDPKHKRKR